MADTWQTVEQAAVSLGMSVRTVNRHITAGKIASRLQEGRREVLIRLPDPEPDALKSAVREAFARLNAAAESELPDESSFVMDDEAEWSDTPEPVVSVTAETPSATPPPQPEPSTVHVPPVGQTADTNTSHLGFDAHTVLALADNASDKAEMAVSAYQALARVAEARVEATRRSARFAWAAVAVMGAGVTVAVGWTANNLTRAKADAEHLQQKLTDTSATVSDVRQERDTLRAELAAARETAARAEGKLEATTGRLEAATLAAARLEVEVKEAKLAKFEAEQANAATQAGAMTKAGGTGKPAVSDKSANNAADVADTKGHAATTQPIATDKQGGPVPTTQPSSFLQRFSRLWNDQ